MVLGRITQVIQLTHDVRSFHINVPDKPDYHSGQFSVISLEAAGKLRKRAYSLASPPHWENIEIIVKLVPDGRVTPVLFEKNVGDIFDVQMPYGMFSLGDDPLPEKMVFLAGGVGIAPLLSMLRHLEWVGYSGRIILLYGNRTPKDIIYADELERLSHSLNLSTVYVIDHPLGFVWDGETGFITKDLIKKYADIAGSSFYICGPPQMVGHMIQNLHDLQVPCENIHYEQW